MAKAIERQARKLRAKGIAVDLAALKTDYIAQHREQNFNSSDSEAEEDPIDVVGVADDDSKETKDSNTAQYFEVSHTNGSKAINPFSIDNLLLQQS